MFREMTIIERDLYAKRYIQELGTIYGKAQKALSKKLSMIDLTLTEKWRTEALLKDTRDIIKNLNPQIRDWAGKSIENNYQKGVTLSGDRLIALKKTDTVLNTAQIHTSAVSALAEATVDDLLIANQSIQKTVDRVIRMTQQKLIEDKAISRMVAEGFVEGATRRTTSDKILTELWSKMKDEKFITINGKQYRPDAYAELVARTRTAEAATQGEINTCLQYGNDLVQVSAHFMDEDPSDICYQYQGRIYSITGADAEFPKLDLAPPYHPNCYSEDTEVYTEAGWRLIKEVVKGERVLSLNPKNMDLEYVKVAWLVGQKSENMIHFTSRISDILVTPGHQMFFQTDWNSKKNKDKWQFGDAEKFVGKKSGRFYASSNWKGKDEVSKEFARFMGIWLSEGSVTHRGGHYVISISQSKKVNPDKYAEMLEIVSQMFPGKNISLNDMAIRFYDKKFGSYLSQFGKSPDKFVPYQIKNSSKEIIREFLDCYRLGDGSLRKGRKYKGGNFRDESVYFSSSKKMADDIGELIIKVGRRPSYYLQKNKGKIVKFRNGNYKINNNCWRISECYSQHITVQNMEIKEVDYNGNAYCLTLPKFHTLLVRRNGKVVWSGNCKHILLPVDRDTLRDRMGDDYKNIVELSNASTPIESFAGYERYLKGGIA